MNATARRVPLSAFSIPFGLIGLADCWLVSARFGLTPVLVGRLLVAIAVAAWAVVGLAYVRSVRSQRASFGSELADPVTGPFGALAVIIPMLAAADVLYPLNHVAGTVVVDVLIAATVGLAGWFTGQWIYHPAKPAQLHPGYFLPSVAGGFIASASAGLVSQPKLAEVLFGLGLVSWIVLGSIVFGRLMLAPPLPPPLAPTMTIEIAPAAVATFAVFVLNGQHVDTLVRLLAGYGLLMVLAQLRLFPVYRRLSFSAGFWAFTFSWAAVGFASLFWLGVTQPAGWRAVSFVLLGLITAFIGWIAARTVAAMRRGPLYPAPPATSPGGAASATAAQPAEPAARR